MTYKKYVELRTSETKGVLTTLSAHRKENPEESNYYSAEFDKACKRILKANNRGIAKKEDGKLFTASAILDNSTDIPNPNKPYKAANN
jgi:hypothetical protein